MLTGYFYMNKINDFAKTLLYKQFLKYFVWSKKDKIWILKKNVIRRIVTTNPSKGEIYYLKLLLNHIKGATSFADLKTVNIVLA